MVIGEADGPTSIIVTSSIWTHLFFWIGLLSLLELARRILLGMTVLKDAQSKNNQNAVAWAVVCGIFGIIPAIVYLFFRNNGQNRLMPCSQCGFLHRALEPYCPNCHVQNVYAQAYVSTPQTVQFQNAAKRFLIATLIFFALELLLGLFIGFETFALIFQYAGM